MILCRSGSKKGREKPHGHSQPSYVLKSSFEVNRCGATGHTVDSFTSSRFMGVRGQETHFPDSALVALGTFISTWVWTEMRALHVIFRVTTYHETQSRRDKHRVAVMLA